MGVVQQGKYPQWAVRSGEIEIGHTAPEQRVPFPELVVDVDGRGRWVDAGAQGRKAARRPRFEASRKRLSAGGGRAVDVEAKTARERASGNG